MKKTIKIASILEKAGSSVKQINIYLENAKWSKDDLALFKHFLNAKLPAEPFQFNAWRKILSPVKFYTNLIIDLNDGPDRKRTMYRALQEDIKFLLEFSG